MARHALAISKFHKLDSNTHAPAAATCWLLLPQQQLRFGHNCSQNRLEMSGALNLNEFSLYLSWLIANWACQHSSCAYEYEYPVEYPCIYSSNNISIWLYRLPNGATLRMRNFPTELTCNRICKCDWAELWLGSVRIAYKFNTSHKIKWIFCSSCINYI